VQLEICVRCPLSLRVREVFWVGWWRVRRHPFLTAVVAAGVVVLVLVALHEPSQCVFKVVPGVRPHFACVEGRS